MSRAQHQRSIQIANAVRTRCTTLSSAYVLSCGPPMSRTTSNTSAGAGTTTNGLARNLSIKTTTKQPQFSSPLPFSDIKHFVTNLRLIDLDLRPDWPGIIVQTFSSKNADQKQRIGGVEWALFRLFEIWDPKETSQVRNIYANIVMLPLTTPLETSTLLPTSRTTSITESSRCPISMFERIEEERCSGSRNCPQENDVG